MTSTHSFDKQFEWCMPPSDEWLQRRQEGAEIITERRSGGPENKEANAAAYERLKVIAQKRKLRHTSPLYHTGRMFYIFAY